jgi:preprotein translocase subunit SecE
MPSTGTGAPRRPASGGGILAWRPRFLVDVITELRKVVWPERDDVVHLTVVVVIVTIIIGAVLGGIDIGFGWLVDKTLLN